MIPIRGCRAPAQAFFVRPEPLVSDALVAPAPRMVEPTRPPRRLCGLDLVHSVAQDFGLTGGDIRSRSRVPLHVEARSVVVRVMRARGLSYKRIAVTLGRTDHSTTVHSVQNYEMYAARNPLVRESYERHRAMDAV